LACVIGRLVELSSGNSRRRAIRLTQLDAVRSGRLDAGFVYNPPEPDGELDQLLVGLHRLALAAPRSHPLGKMKQLRLRDMADASFVWFPRRESPAFYDRLMYECVRAGLKSPRIVQEASNEATIMTLVAQGMGGRVRDRDRALAMSRARRDFAGE
jgi:DNA-binding transcriptional LysR family regulator